jgi:heat shock protein HslJ
MISQASTSPNAPSRVIAPRVVNPLIGTWHITAYDAQDLTGATVTFGRNSYQAKFCNGTNGRYRVVQNRIITTQGMSTLMACADQNLMDAESHFSTVKSWTQ